jgi:hypothetical protein
MAATVSDEKLLQRARYGGRNITALAILATLVAVFSFLAIPFAKTGDLILFLLIFPCVAVAFWMLAIAARRGNALSLNFVLGVLTLQFLVSIVGEVVAYVVSGGKIPMQLVFIIIPLLVIAVLARNRADLLELRRRGLWDSLFGAARRSKTLCVVGGLLLCASILVLYGDLLFQAVGTSRNVRLRKEFSDLVLVDEKSLLGTIQSINPSNAKQVLPGAQAKADQLEIKAQGIAKRSPAGSSVHTAATTYVKAVQKWRVGMTLLAGNGSEYERIKTLLVDGDQLRKKAVSQFDANYAKKK